MNEPAIDDPQVEVERTDRALRAGGPCRRLVPAG